MDHEEEKMAVVDRTDTKPVVTPAVEGKESKLLQLKKPKGSLNLACQLLFWMCGGYFICKVILKGEAHAPCLGDDKMVTLWPQLHSTLRFRNNC